MTLSQASHFARPLGSNIPGRADEVIKEKHKCTCGVIAKLGLLEPCVDLELLVVAEGVGKILHLFRSVFKLLLTRIKYGSMTLAHGEKGLVQ